MSRAVTVRALIGMAECPYCEQQVYLGDCQPRDEIVAVTVDEQTTPVGAAMPRWWECAHLAAGPTGPITHRWETPGLIEFRPVLSLHVDPVDLIADIIRALGTQQLDRIPDLIHRLARKDPRKAAAVLNLIDPASTTRR